MKHLKLFESYLEDKLDKLKKEIKGEIDPYIFSITDEYQTTSEYDTVIMGSREWFISYRYIVCNKQNYDSLREKVKNFEKILEKLFDAGIQTGYLDKDSWKPLNKEHLLNTIERGEEINILISVVLKK